MSSPNIDHARADIKVSSAALREALSQSGTMEIERMAKITAMSKELSNNGLKMLKVELGATDLLGKNAKLIEGNSTNNAVRAAIEAEAKAA